VRKRYIGVWSDGADLQVQVGPTLNDVLLKPNGRIGGLVPAKPEGPPAGLQNSCVVVFLVTGCPSEILAVLTEDLGQEVCDATYLTHGHASVALILDDEAKWAEVLPSVAEYVRGYEVWPILDGKMSAGTVTVVAPEPETTEALGDISCEGVGFESAAQLRQFNANLALLSRVVLGYAPETWPLIASLHAQVAQIADRLRVDETTLSHQQRTALMSSQTVLIETNAVVTLYCSQLGSGTLPLYRATFPVGEYSLLGIGGMCRSAWRLYEHLNRMFARHDHPTKIRTMYPSLGAFDPFGGSAERRDFSTWRQINYALDRLPETPDEKPRVHVPYFSSRWGFHESLHSISLSWQCLYASATKEWNLLTVTHEFLHSQVRAIFAEIMKPQPAASGDHAEQITNRYNSRSRGTSALEAMQVAYVEALVVCRAANYLARQLTGEDTNVEMPVDRHITTSQLRDLVRDHSGVIHEITVHVLDYRYVYNGRDDEYVTSIWSSWALVPSVADQIEHYVLRTICALGARPEGENNREKFANARQRFRDILVKLNAKETARPVLADALETLDNVVACRRLSVQFSSLLYVVEMTQTFFFDQRLNSELMADAQTEEVDGRFVYDVEPGEYRGERVESPVGFLLDRFPTYSDRAGTDEAEFESIWQMLQLI
jgi:hypothetical protein